MMEVIMDDTTALTDIENERLFRIILGSLEVKYKSQFFLWAQGAVHSLVPHEVMICTLGESSRSKLVIEHFSSYPLPVQDVESLVNLDGGMVSDASRVWAELGEQPLLVCNSNRESSIYRRFESTLMRYAFPNLVIHGIPRLPGCPGTLVIFANLPQPLAPRLTRFVEILLPFVHSAFLRMLSNERIHVTTATPASELVTVRESEILHWVRDGKSNHEIGLILSISPLTVKNHVQKILRKLGAQNRAQAVARAISLQLIKNHDA